jgi:hypothetical protein
MADGGFDEAGRPARKEMLYHWLLLFLFGCCWCRWRVSFGGIVIGTHFDDADFCVWFCFSAIPYLSLYLSLSHNMADSVNEKFDLIFVFFS